MPEIVKAGYIKFSKQKFPKNIFFVWTNNHYRPLWTYEFKSEDKIKMIFVGSINGLILKVKTLTKMILKVCHCNLAFLLCLA